MPLSFMVLPLFFTALFIQYVCSMHVFLCSTHEYTVIVPCIFHTHQGRHHRFDI